MVEQKRRNWLDKFGKWALDVLPGDDGKHSGETDASQTVESIAIQEVSPEKTIHSQQDADDTSSQQSDDKARIGGKPAQTSDPSAQATRPNPEEKSDKTLIEAWRAFEVA